MLFGPVFTAEIVTSSRRTRHMLVRVLYGCVLLMALAMVYSEEFGPWRGNQTTVQYYADAASSFFSTYSVLQLLGVLLVAPALTAGTIAAERERRTIEYLFATDLTNWEIVIGKLSASLLRSIGLLLVGPPVLALAMWMGGVGPDRLAAVFVITLSTLVAVTSLALSVSVWSPRARQAFGRVYFYLIVTLAVPPFLYTMSFAGVGSFPTWLQPALGWFFAANELLLGANPFFALAGVLGSTMTTRSSIWEFVWPMLAWHALFSALCIGASLWAVRRVHLRSASVGVRPEKLVRARDVSEDWPMLWKELNTERAATKIGLVGGILAGGLLILFVGLTGWMFYLDQTSSGQNYIFTQYSAMIGTVIACASILFIGMRGATSISAEKERDTFPTLLSTLVEPSEVVIAKWLSAMYSARWLWVCLGALWLTGGIARPIYLVAIPGLAFSVAVISAFAGMLGTWCSLWCKTSTRALGATLATLLFLGGGYMFIGACCLSFIGFDGDEAMILGFTPWLLFLLVSPTFLPEVLEEMGRRSLNDEVVFAFAAYFLGTLGYLFVTGVLLQLAITQFDRLVGRTHLSFDLPPINSKRITTAAPPALPKAETSAMAIVVDEQAESP